MENSATESFDGIGLEKGGAHENPTVQYGWAHMRRYKERKDFVLRVRIMCNCKDGPDIYPVDDYLLCNHLALLALWSFQFYHCRATATTRLRCATVRN